MTCERFDNSKLQNAICYAIDGDQINVLNILVQKIEDPWVYKSSDYFHIMTIYTYKYKYLLYFLYLLFVLCFL